MCRWDFVLECFRRCTEFELGLKLTESRRNVQKKKEGIEGKKKARFGFYLV